MLSKLVGEHANRYRKGPDMEAIDTLLSLEEERDSLEEALEKNRDKVYAEVISLANSICSACDALLASDGDYPSSAIEDLHKDAKNALLVLDGVDGRFDDEKPSVRIGRYDFDYPSYTAVSIFDDVEPVYLEITDDDLEVLGLN